MRKRKPKQKSVTFNTGYIGLTVKVAGDPFEVSVRGESFVTAWQGDTASTLQKWVDDHGQAIRQKLGGYVLYENGEVKAPFKEFALSGNVSVVSEAEEVALQSSQLETVWGNKLEGGVSVNLYGGDKTVQFFDNSDYKAFLSEMPSLKREGGTVSTPCFLSDIKGVIVREVSGEVTYEQVPYDEYANREDFAEFWVSQDIVKFPGLNLSSGTNFSNAWESNQLVFFPELDLSSGTNFENAWDGNKLTHFSKSDLSSGTFFSVAWFNNELESFPPNMFDNLTSPQNYCFVNAWTEGGNAIDQQGVENILVSIDASGADAPQLGKTIDIDTDGDLPSTAADTAITNLKAKGWDVVLDGVSQ